MVGVLTLVQSIQKCSSTQCECSSTETENFLDGIEGVRSRMLTSLAAFWDIQCTTKKIQTFYVLLGYNLSNRKNNRET